MKTSLFLGIITLAYGMSLQAFASDSLDGRLTIVAHVVEPTCRVDMTGEKPRTDCRDTGSRFTAGSERPNYLGVSTQRVMLPGDTKRQIVLNTYD